MPKDQSNYVVCLGVLNTLTHLLLGAITVVCVVFALANNFGDSMKQHVVLCVIGYTLMMSQGIMSLNKYNGWSANLNYYNKNIAHRVVGVIGAALAIAGSAIRIQGWPGVKFSTTHGILGLIALILTCLSLIGGVASIYIQQKKLLRTCHAIAGCLTLTAAMVCLIYGLDKASFRNFISDGTANFMIAITCIATVGVLTTATVGIVRRLKN